MPDYFTLAELRALPDMSDTATYPDAAAESAAAYITAIIEREVGTSFVSRTVADEPHDGGGRAVILRSPYVISVTSATESGVSVTDSLTVRNGILQRFAAGSYTPASWLHGVGNVMVSYVAGYSTTPPADIKEAALQGTRLRLLTNAAGSSQAARQVSTTNEVGGTVTYVIAGPDRPTGFPEVDAVIMGWKRRLHVVGVA